LRALKSRVIKNLRVYVARRKFLRLMDGKNKILRREENLRTMQKMLNAFKYYKVYHLFTKTLHKIDDEITPTMRDVNSIINNYVDKQENKARGRAIVTLVLKPTMRLINEFFMHWRTITEQKWWKFTEGFKSLIMKIHSLRLQTAFNKWRVQRSQVVI